MRVYVERNPDGRVSQAFAYYLRMDVLPKQDGGVGVPEIVKPHVGQIGLI